MKDFNQIISVCKETTSISTKVVDDFLIYYAAAWNNLEYEMNRTFAAYKHITQKFPKEWENKLKAQYIAHKIFKDDGLIKKFLNHSALKRMNQEEMAYLKFQAENPWRFSFSIIKEKPFENFYVMEDVFRGEEFLLYSPGVTNTLKSQPTILWFNMIAFNGACWQSYGPIGAYRSFEPDDIFFFATELNPEIEDEEDLASALEIDPVPYMMLIAGANYPVIVNKKDQMVHAIAEYHLDNMDTKSLTRSFITEYNNGVYRLSLKKWKEPPHFSQAYYDEDQKMIILSSMTDRGFKALAEGLNAYGYNFSPDPFVRVTLSMVITASEILKRKIDLLRYENLFSKESTPVEKENLDRLNKLLHLAMKDINAGRRPDIEAYARQAGVDPETARSVIGQALDRFKKMNKRRKT
ncbi:MAG TPA: hypothetical protein VMV74_11190 [Bacteroidales bacterium]|nr:hypothetical protein [Bacteroidales bacterium]